MGMDFALCERVGGGGWAGHGQDMDRAREWRMDDQRGLAPQTAMLVRRNGRLAGLIVDREQEGTNGHCVLFQTYCANQSLCV